MDGFGVPYSSASPHPPPLETQIHSKCDSPIPLPHPLRARPFLKMAFSDGWHTPTIVPKTWKCFSLWHKSSALSLEILKTFSNFLGFTDHGYFSKLLWSLSGFPNSLCRPFRFHFQTLRTLFGIFRNHFGTLPWRIFESFKSFPVQIYFF